MTHQSISAAVEAGTVIWDRGLPASVTGLHMKVLATGGKSYYVYYRTKAGQERRPKIGDALKISLTEARKRARFIMGLVAVGEDPKGQWDEHKEELFVQELFDETWKRHWDHTRFHQSGWAKEVRSLYDRHIAPSFGIFRLSELTAPLVCDWHHARRETPVAANRALEVLSKMFRFGQQRGWVKDNPCTLVSGFREKKRTRFASEEEIARLGAAIEEEAVDNPRGAAFLYLLIYSGSRPSAIARARWEHLERVVKEGKLYGILTLDGKSAYASGTKDQIVLPEAVMEILDRLEPKTKTLTGVKMPRKMWARVKQKAGCPDLWARDWRRTFATVGLSDGLELGLMGELLNHQSAQSTTRYAKLLPTRRVEAAQQIGRRMQSLLQGLK